MSEPLGRGACAVILASALLALALGTPAVADEIPVGAAEPEPLFDEDFDPGDPFEGRDPFERVNRGVLHINQGLDTIFWDPLTRGYQFVVPEPARRALHRALVNLNSPSTFVNDLLQLRILDAGETLGRFVLNSTVGMAGLFDAGKEAGWEFHRSDFGQTLALVGVKSGPYLLLPVLGPSTVRDGFGDLVDRAMQPTTYFLGFTPNIFITSGQGLATRESKAEAIDALRESAVDYYSVLRSAYLQNREAEIRSHQDARPGPVAQAILD